jgi:hypothetical protein
MSQGPILSPLDFLAVGGVAAGAILIGSGVAKGCLSGAKWAFLEVNNIHEDKRTAMKVLGGFLATIGTISAIAVTALAALTTTIAVAMTVQAIAPYTMPLAPILGIISGFGVMILGIGLLVNELVNIRKEFVAEKQTQSEYNLFKD